MDTVVFILINNKAYIGDIYNGKVKQITFKATDYWEIYHNHDFKDLIEHMNFPMNYNKFKNSHIKILYEEPKMYDYLYKVADKLTESESMAIGKLSPMILAAILNKYGQREMPSKVRFMEQCYSVAYNSDNKLIINSILDDDVTEEEIPMVSVLDLCNLLKTNQNEMLATLENRDIEDPLFQMLKTFINQKIKAEDILEHYLVFSPATIYKNFEKGRKKIFQVEDILLECISDASVKKVNSQDKLFSYEHRVYKWFGKIQKQEIIQKSPIEGTFLAYRRTDKGNIWAQKDEFIGVVSQKENNKEAIKNWIKMIGMD